MLGEQKRTVTVSGDSLEGGRSALSASETLCAEGVELTPVREAWPSSRVPPTALCFGAESAVLLQPATGSGAKEDCCEHRGSRRYYGSLHIMTESTAIIHMDQP